MRWSLMLTVLFLNFHWGCKCFGQNENDKLSQFFQLDTQEAKEKKLKSCSSTVYYTTQGDTSCAFGDYFVFDTSGRIVGHMLCSEGGWPDTKTYTYSSSTDQLVESRSYQSYVMAQYEMDQTFIVESSDRDSMLRNSVLRTREIHRKGAQSYTTYYDREGNVESEMYPVYDENDSLAQVRWVEAGFLREVWVYRPNGTLLSDTSFDRYEGMIVWSYNERGHLLTQVHYDTNGVSYRRESTEYKYDNQGHEIDKVEINSKGKIERHTVTVYDDKGKISSILITNDSGEVIHSSSRKVQTVKSDTIITEYSLYYLKAEQQYSISYTSHRIIPSAHTVERAVTKYRTDVNKNIIGDTSKQFEVTVFNERGSVIAFVSTTGGVEKSSFRVTYDLQGHVIERLRTGSEGTTKETFTYYEDGTRKTYVSEAGGNIHTTQYNAEGKIVQVSEGPLNNPRLRVTVYTFDPNGLLVRKEVFEDDRRSIRTEFKYTFY